MEDWGQKVSHYWTFAKAQNYLWKMLHFPSEMFWVIANLVTSLFKSDGGRVSPPRPINPHWHRPFRTLPRHTGGKHTCRFASDWARSWWKKRAYLLLVTRRSNWCLHLTFDRLGGLSRHRVFFRNKSWTLTHIEMKLGRTLRTSILRRFM